MEVGDKVKLSRKGKLSGAFKKPYDQYRGVVTRGPRKHRLEKNALWANNVDHRVLSVKWDSWRRAQVVNLSFVEKEE